MDDELTEETAAVATTPEDDDDVFNDDLKAEDGDKVESLDIDLSTKDLNREDDISSIQVYLNSIGKTPLLTAKEEIDLAKRIEKNDIQAKIT